jgi:hypothetical protein
MENCLTVGTDQFRWGIADLNILGSEGKLGSDRIIKRCQISD